MIASHRVSGHAVPRVRRLLVKKAAVPRAQSVHLHHNETSLAGLWSDMAMRITRGLAMG